MEIVKEIISEAEFKTAVNEEKVSVVLFYAKWCSACKLSLTEFYLVANDLSEKLEFYKVDVDVLEGSRMKFDISTIPVLAIFEKGEIREKFVGLKSKAQLCEILIKYL